MVEHNLALGTRCDERIMGHDDDGSALLVQLTEQVKHDFLVLLIQIAGRFVRKNQFRAVDERTCDAHALLFATGKLAGQMVGTLLQTDAFQRFQRLLLVDYGMVVLCHHHVFHSRQMRYQIELLEHQSDHVLTHVGKLPGVQILQLAAFQHDGTL